MNAETGKYIIAAGVLIVIAGIVIYFFHDRLHWIGRLPGDIRMEGERGGFYFPIVTCIVVSVVLSGLMALAKRLFGP